MGGYDIVGDRTPIHIAAANGSMEIVRYLIDHADIDPEMPSGSGMTALSMAKQGGHYPVITLLTGGGSGGVLKQDNDPSAAVDHGHAYAAGGGPMDTLLSQRGGGGGRAVQRDILRRESWSGGDTVGGRGGDSKYRNGLKGGGAGLSMNDGQSHGGGGCCGWLHGQWLDARCGPGEVRA